MNKGIIKIKSTKPPIVGLDSTAHAAYVRFSKKKVAKTELVNSGKTFVTMDLAADGSVIGIELVGVNEFSIDTLLDQSKVQAPKSLTRKTRYVSACA